MVCTEDDSTECVVQNMMAFATQKRIILLVRPTYTVDKLFQDVAFQFDSHEPFQLLLQTTDNADPIVLNDQKGKTLKEVGVNFNYGCQNNIIMVGPVEPATDLTEKITIIDPTPLTDSMSDDELALGASASPTEPADSSSIRIPQALPMYDSEDVLSSTYKSPMKLYSGNRLALGYVGLVNQAMTCYLNSLLQALFMTPEFRNALYNWEFDGIGENKSIPYQLQKLFLNLQTSSKMAVETTDLTKSFGWDSTEAWQQHDIQELCRVMFDALEQKFKNTKQADLINRLYQGKMIDYVKCLECSTEKSREDTFLDIPLPVKPFGSAVAYGSVEEALRAFVQPETLDGNNQYFCEKCNKKCDAHKGLKFYKFPYILTLHLKRFDFDYNTLHRIKLNDKVTFPQTLNLNNLVNTSNPGFNPATVNGEAGPSEPESVESAIKLNDDCSTTDSGSALEEESCNGTTFTGSSVNNDPDLQEDDEGIDMSTSTDHKTNASNESGPYLYELFSIMIHSGSASGGHYYAYIKDFETGEWYCFNDQNVTTITQEDIQKSFGGGAFRVYYSGAYSSSTNAYMLMYRQIDPTRNCSAIKVDEFPEHIKQLLTKLKEKEESNNRIKEMELEMTKLKVFFYNPKMKKMVNSKIYMSSDSTLEDTLQQAYSRLTVTPFSKSIKQCRLVAYDSSTEMCQQSFEGREDEPIGSIMNSLKNSTELLLEIREPDDKFEVYLPGGIMTRVYTIDLTTSDIDGPFIIRALELGTIGAYKKLIVNKLNLPNDNICVAIHKGDVVAILDSDDVTLAKEDYYIRQKVFISVCPTTINEEIKSKFRKIVERYENIISLYFTIPKADAATLKKLSIPAYNSESPESPNRAITPTQMIRPATKLNDDQLVEQENNENALETCGENGLRNRSLAPVEPESNSEDSSLSDGDRTLVDSAQGDLSHISSISHSPACSDPQLSSPEEVNHSKRIANDSDDDGEFSGICNHKSIKYYFKAYPCEEIVQNDDSDEQRLMKVLVDKRMNVGNLKGALQTHIGVPKEYFKLLKTTPLFSESECTRMTESLSAFKDGERLIIELGRALRKGEYKISVHFLKLSEINDETDNLTHLCDWIICNGGSVGETKREILTHLASINKLENLSYDKCRLRKKTWKFPSTIYLDDQKFGDDYHVSNNWEIILQEMEDTSQSVKDFDDITVFVRRWYPSTMTLDPFNEIVINSSDKNDMKKNLSTISGIPEENIEYAKIASGFPSNTIVLRNIHTEQTWTSASEPSSNLQDGFIFYFRDKTEPLKEMAAEERRELSSKDNGSIDYRAAPKSSYSRRKEHALKIYLDSPKKTDD